MAATIKIVVEVSGGLDKVKADVADLGESAKRSGGGFNALQEIATGALRAIGEAAINLAGAALQKLGGFIVDSIGVAGSFQAKMNEVGAALGKGFEPGTEGLNEFKDLFISLGKELPVSTAEVQDAALALVKGGLSPAVVEAGALRDSLNFAAAAGMGLADAAELTIKQLGTFVPIGASVEEQTRFMADAQNLLVKAAGASTLDVKELGNAMLAAGGQARAAGLDYGEFVTTMGLISPSFGSAAEAGTSFKNFLTRLNPTTKAAVSSMTDLGLFTEETGSAFFDASGKFVGMEKASELLKNALTGLSDQQRIQYLQTIFGNDAMGAATALAGAGADGFAAFADKMREANGVQGQAEATQQGFNFQLENMKGSLEALQITIGTALLPVLASLIGDYLTPAINTVMELTDTFINGGSATSIFADVSAMLRDVWAAIQPALMAVWAVLQNQVYPILNDLALTLIPIVNAAVQVLAGFWRDILVPAVLMLWQVLSTVVLPILAALAGWLKDVLPPAVQFLADFLTGTLFPALHTVYDFISVNVVPILALAAQWLIENVPIAVQAASDVFNNVLIPALTAVWNFIQLNVLPIFATLWTWLSVTLPAGLQVLANFWSQTLLPAINAVWSFLNTYVIPLITALVNLHFAVMGVAIRALTALWSEVLLPAITGIWAFIKDKLGPVFQWLNDMVLHPLILILGDIYATVLGSINPILAKLTSLVKDDVSKAFNNLNSFASAAAGGLSKIGQAVQSVIDWINDLVAALGSVDIPDWLQGHSPPPMADWFTYIGEAVGAVNAQLPDLQMNLAAQVGSQGQSISNTASTRSFSYSPTIYASGGGADAMDLALASSLASV